MIDVKRIIESLRSRGRFPELKRNSYFLGDEDMKSLTIALGKEIAPGFVLDKDNSWFYTQLGKWAFGLPFEAASPDRKSIIEGQPCKGLVIAGKIGTGKSVALHVALLLAEVSGARLMVDKKTEGVTWEERRATDITTEYAREGTLEPYCKCRILCVQDLGSEPAETLYMGNRVPVLRQILETRGDNPLLMTLLSTNLGPGQIETVYGQRVRSRLFEMCNYLPLLGPDRRLNAPGTQNKGPRPQD